MNKRERIVMHDITRHVGRWGRLLALSVGFSAWAALLGAQTVMTATTLSAAVDATQQTITVASATTFATGAKVWIDQEQMTVISVSGTVITVRRGSEGTAARGHANAETVLVGTETATVVWFYGYDPNVGQSCTRGTGQARNSPWINTRTGVVWNCLGSTSLWNGTHTAPITYNSVQNGTP